MTSVGAAHGALAIGVLYAGVRFLATRLAATAKLFVFELPVLDGGDADAEAIMAPLTHMRSAISQYFAL